MRDNGDYSINSEGRDSSNWSSRPGSNRMDKFGSDRRNTEDIYNECGCNQPISEADREKRVEELDEVIHDKLGKYDEDTDQDAQIKSTYDDRHPILDNHPTDTPSRDTTVGNRATTAGSTIGATSPNISDEVSPIGADSKKTDELVDCSSDMSINDLASFSDANNGLSDDTANDDVIIIEQVEISFEDPNQDFNQSSTDQDIKNQNQYRPDDTQK